MLIEPIIYSVKLISKNVGNTAGGNKVKATWMTDHIDLAKRY
jgi:hypothetical protein